MLYPWGRNSLRIFGNGKLDDFWVYFILAKLPAEKIAQGYFTVSMKRLISYKYHLVSVCLAAISLKIGQTTQRAMVGIKL